MTFYDPESVDCYRRHWGIAKHTDLTVFLDKHFVRVHVPMADPFCQLYCEDLFPIDAFPVTAIHDPVTMRCMAVFANIARNSLPDTSITRRPLTLLEDPECLLGELMTMVEELPPLPVPDKVIQRMFGLLDPVELLGNEEGSDALRAAIRAQADVEQRKRNAMRDKQDVELDEEALLLYGIDKGPRRPGADGQEVVMDALPPDTSMVVMTALDEAMHFAQASGRYVLISVHADNSSQVSRTLNRRLWYNEPLQFTISTKYVLVRLDANVDPMAKLVLNTPVTSSELDEHAHAAPPYLEVMHPFETLRIPVFGTDPKTGVMWGDARPHVVEAFLLDLVIKHPVAALGWTHADAPPLQSAMIDADGDGVAALVAMSASGTAGTAEHASDDAAWDLIDKSDAATEGNESGGEVDRGV
ncbi:hypothetical protein GGF32_005538 [Allomyces javanicus]|nr:hypothetical protein GGF32_005538 [Allomyces javanicus]